MNDEQRGALVEIGMAFAFNKPVYAVGTCKTIQPNKISSQSGVTALSISFEKKIVTTGTGGIGEIINSKNGYICESNVHSMSKAINYALNDKNFNFDKLKELKDKLSWSSFSKKIMNIVDEI